MSAAAVARDLAQGKIVRYEVTEERKQLMTVQAPAHVEVLAKASEFLLRTGRSGADLADLVARDWGHCARSTMLDYLNDTYTKHRPHIDVTWMDRRVWSTITRHWPQPAAKQYGGEAGSLLRTTAFRLLHRRVKQCVDGALVLAGGMVGSEKSFLLENIVAQRIAAGRRDVLYIYCDYQLPPSAMLRRIATEAGVFTRAARSYQVDAVREAILSDFAARPYPPAIIIDEAQHLVAPSLRMDTLEVLRGLHDRSRRGRPDERPGCGILLAGSHDLFSQFTSKRADAELRQLNERFDERDYLTGMTRDEALEIARRMLGRLSQEQQEKIIERATKFDAYAVRPDGAADPREYLSCRALVKYCEKQRRRRESQ